MKKRILSTAHRTVTLIDGREIAPVRIVDVR